MVIKVAVALLGAVCVVGPLVQTLRFRRFGRRSPWRLPAPGTMEASGWLALAGALALLFSQGGLVLAEHPWFGLLPALPPAPWQAPAGLAVGLAGAAVTFGSQAAMADSWRIGTDPASDRPLVTSGIFAHVRNPIYLGLILQVLGAALLMPTAASAVAAVAAIGGLNLIVASEERFLLDRYGDAYRAYLARTGRFLPRGRLTS